MKKPAGDVSRASLLPPFDNTDSNTVNTGSLGLNTFVNVLLSTIEYKRNGPPGFIFYPKALPGVIREVFT